VFCLEYYIFPAHPWMANGVIVNEANRILSYEEATTTAFVQAAMFELLVVWNCRSEKRSVWRMGRDAFKNKFFVIAEIASIALTLGITYIPITQELFHLTALSLTDLGYVIAVAALALFVLPEITMNKKLWKWK
jgi:magnesium-transporting ATPase (P-type)